MKFSSGRLYLPGASVMLLLLFTRLYINLLPALNQAKLAYVDGQALTIETGLKSGAIQRLLTTGNYYTDPRDVALVADSLPAKLLQNGTLDNLGAVNKRQFSVLALVAWRSRIGGADFRSRLQLSRQQMGFDSVLYKPGVDESQAVCISRDYRKRFGGNVWPGFPGRSTDG